MLIGYARISSSDQSLDLQIDALKACGCEQIFSDIASGAKTDRSGLTNMIEFARFNDTIVVWRLDRLGRSMSHLIHTIQFFHEKGVGFRSLTENMDTTTTGGMLIFHIFASLAEFERALIRERTRAGLVAARARGRVGGRPRVMNEKTISMARILLSDPDRTVREVCETLNVSKSTLYRHVGVVNPNKISL